MEGSVTFYVVSFSLKILTFFVISIASSNDYAEVCFALFLHNFVFVHVATSTIMPLPRGGSVAVRSLFLISVGSRGC